MSGSNSGGPYECDSKKRLKQLLRDPKVKRDPQRLVEVQRELAFRKQLGEGS